MYVGNTNMVTTVLVRTWRGFGDPESAQNFLALGHGKEDGANIGILWFAEGRGSVAALAAKPHHRLVLDVSDKGADRTSPKRSIGFEPDANVLAEPEILGRVISWTC
jgi:hypothetical protein